MINARERLLLQELECMTTGLQEVNKQFNMGTGVGLQAMEMVPEPLCSKEGTDKELLFNG